MNRAVILHSVADAEHCIRNGHHRGALLFSTHTSVDVHLRKRHGITCHCLSEFIPLSDIRPLKERSARLVNDLVRALDEYYASALNEQLGLNLRYFTPLYTYLAKYQLMGYLTFHQALALAIARHGLTKCLIYNKKFNTFFATTNDMAHLQKVSFPSCTIEIMEAPASAGEATKTLTIRRMLALLKNGPLSLLKKILQKAARWLRPAQPPFPRFENGKPTILVHEHLYQISFIKQHLSGYNVVYYSDHARLAPEGFNPQKAKLTLPALATALPATLSAATEDIPFLELLWQDLREDFTAHIRNYADALVTLKGIGQKYPLALGIWGNPPVEKTKALLFEYLHAEKVPVLGTQHGAAYGTNYEPWHFDSDFNRCDHFISYGFTADDLRRLYPQTPVPCAIAPLGYPLPVAAAVKAEAASIDILYVATNSCSMLAQGMARFPPHLLTARQVQLVEYLSALKGLRSCLKLMPGSNDSNCSILALKDTLPPSVAVTDIWLTEYLQKYRPRTVIMDFPSTPLLEVLPLDTEIFLLDDPVLPFENQCLEELQQRVHYADNVPELLTRLQQFQNGKLTPLRDQTFERHYLTKAGTRAALVAMIADLAQGREPQRQG